MRIPRSLILLCLLFVFPLAAAAQETRSATEPRGLAIQIQIPNGTPPSFLPVPAANARRSAMWTPRFERVPGFQPEPGTLPVKAVNIGAIEEGDAARVFVSLFVGVTSFEKELQVGSYLLREGEHEVVKELAAFGVEPFELTAVRPKVAAPPLPAVSTRTTSLEVVGLEPTKSTIPSYKLSLRNLSNKNVAALQVEVYEGSRLRLSGSPHGQQGLPLIPAGAVLETNVLGAKDTAMTRTGYQPASPPYQMIVVSTLVFEDGSFEGDSSHALRINARRTGERIQLARAVAALKRTLDATGLTAPDAVAMLIKNVSAFDDEVPPGVAQRLIKDTQPPGHTEPASVTGTIQVVMRLVKKNLSEEIEAYQKSHQTAPEEKEFRAWLSDTFDRYAQWRLRLR
jgi:hypothetical protein